MSKILIVEDEHGAREALKTFFEVLGHEVTAVASGSEAIRAGTAQPPRVLISDWLLQEEACDGVKVAKQLYEKSPGLAIIFITGYPIGELRTRSFGFSVQAFLSKPISLHELNTIVSDILSREANGQDCNSYPRL